MKKIFLQILIFFLSVFSLSLLFAQEAILKKAEKEIDQGSYKDAILTYNSFLKSEGENGGVYYNLATAHHRLGELGKAIFYLKKSQELIPGNGDVLYNLNFLRNKTVDKLPTEKGWFLEWWDRLPLTNKIMWRGLLLFSLLFWGVSIIGTRRKGEVLLWFRYFSLTMLVLFTTVLIVKWTYKLQFGVVTNSEAKVYSAIGKDNVVLFTLHEGSEFDIIERRESEWIQIALLDGKKGWIRSQDVISEETAN